MPIKEFPLAKIIWNDKLSISFIGTGENFKAFISTLVEEYNKPKFGHMREDWDEENNG